MGKETTHIMEKIRKLMNMAEHKNANENEAANAARMAEALLRKYNLTMTDITPEEVKSSVTEESWTGMKWTPGSAPTWATSLAIAVSNAHDCFVIWGNAAGNDSHVAKTQFNLTFVGSEMDTAVAKEVFAYLYKTTIRLTDAHFKANPVANGSSPRVMKNSYRIGMSDRLCSKLIVMTEEKEFEFKEAAATGASLVVVKKDAIGSYLANKGTSAEYSKSKRKSSMSEEAYSAGHSKGGSVSMNK